MASLIEDLRAHGGVYRGGSGGGEDVKFVRYTTSLNEPQNPSLNDLWIKTDATLGTVYINDIELLNPNIGDTLIKFGGREDLFKPEYYKSKSDYFGFRAKTSDSPLLLDSDIVHVHGVVGSVKTWNGEFYDYHDTYRWNGTEWYAFSYNLGGVIVIGSEPPSATAKGVASYDDNLDLMVKTDDAPITRYLGTPHTSCVDPIRKLYCTQTGIGRFSIFNYNTMEFLKEVQIRISDAGYDNASDIDYCTFDSYGNLFITVRGSSGTLYRRYVIKYDSNFNKIDQILYGITNSSGRVVSTISYINGDPHVFSVGTANSTVQIQNLVTGVQRTLSSTITPDKIISIKNIFYAMSSAQLRRFEYNPTENTLIETHFLSLSSGSGIGTDGEFLYVQSHSHLQRRSLDNLSVIDFNTTSSSTGGVSSPYLAFDRGYIYAFRSQQEFHQVNKKTLALEKIKTVTSPNAVASFISKIGEYNMFQNMV